MKRRILATVTAALIISMASSAMITAGAEEVTTTAPTDSVTTTGDVVSVDSDVDIDVQRIFESWVNYPDSSLGKGYDAGWRYDSSNKWLNTTKNVGWTGFYNPDITNLTTGKFSFQMMSEDSSANDPLGFTWGMQMRGTEEDPEYSFYAFEECHVGGSSDPYWSVAYISSWKPAKSGSSHQGPLYHGTIDAKDGKYHHDGSDADSIGFAEGEVLAHGNLDKSFRRTFHNVVINVLEDKVVITLNGEELTTVDAPVQAGSFGPYSVSNPQAYFKDLKMTSTNDVMLNPMFEYRDETGTKINTASTGEAVSIADLSTFEGSEIVNRTWTVTKDDTVIYTGNTPYTNYTDEIGTYVTGLVVENAFGVASKEYTDTLVVTGEVVNKLYPDFVYVDKDGKEITSAVIKDDVKVLDKSTAKGSPIASYEWTVLRNDKEIYKGDTPYTKYTEQSGTYETTLVIKNAAGEVSSKVSKKLTVVSDSTSPKTSDSRAVLPTAVAAIVSGLAALACKKSKLRRED